MDSKVYQLVNRHLAKVLSQLDEINTPEITKNAVKQGFHWLANDIDEYISEVKNGKIPRE